MSLWRQLTRGLRALTHRESADRDVADQESGRRFSNDDSARARFFTQALEAVRRVPGVAAAAFTSQLPLSGDVDVYGLQLEWRPDEKSEGMFRYAVTPGYFDAMNIPLRAGRLLDEHDRAGGIVPLILAAVSIYGILSGSVTERMREIGVRSALGASRRDILTFIGIVIGIIGAVAASQAIISMLYGISRFDPITYIGVIALLATISAIACWLPAWRAAKIDPSITFRAE